MNKILDDLIQIQKKQSFVKKFRNNVTNQEALGILISQHFEWDGIDILRTCAEALTDANFHKEASIVENLIK